MNDVYNESPFSILTNIQMWWPTSLKMPNITTTSSE